jgi:UrcA family protein
MSRAAHAAPASDVATVTVWFSDLDLATANGVRELYGRLRIGARQVCGPFDSRGLGARALWQQCYAHALSDAVMRLHLDRLTALHDRTSDGTTKPARRTS